MHSLPVGILLEVLNMASDTVLRCVGHSKVLMGQQQQVGLECLVSARSQCPSHCCLLLLPCAVAAVTMQGKLEELEQEIMEVNGNSERLARSYNELVELQLVLERAGSFFDQVHILWDTHVGCASCALQLAVALPTRIPEL